MDANQREIVAVLEARGHMVQSLVAVGDGCPDLLVLSGAMAGPTRRSKLVLVECKDGSRIPSERKLTPAQLDWHRRWSDAPVFVVEDAFQAIAAVEGE